jgi:hypothetical protein
MRAEVTFVPILFLVWIALGLVIWIRGEGRAVEQLQRWASAHGLRIVAMSRAYIWHGPFMIWSSRAQRVFTVSFADSKGNVRDAWARVGGWWMGTLTEQVDVRWRKPLRGTTQQ